MSHRLRFRFSPSRSTSTRKRNDASFRIFVNNQQDKKMTYLTMTISFIISNKNAFQWDAYRPLVDRIRACTAHGGGGVFTGGGGGLSAQGGVCTGGLPGGGSSQGGVCRVVSGGWGGYPSMH